MSMDVKVGKRAVTHLQVLERYGNYASLIEAKLETGRTHQVRIHLTGEGHSLLGDPVYGKPGPSQPKWLALSTPLRALISELPGQALHARVLGFNHPVTGAPLRFEAPLPPALQKVLDFLWKGEKTARE
jgi:23S rRNA pseudouridine1911/1915/1917 synthase